MKHPRIQIAGVRNNEEALLLSELGVDHIGFPLGPGIREPDTSIDEAASIIEKLPKNCEAVLITYLSDALNVLDLCKKLGVSRVQLHGEISLEETQKLKTSLYIIKSLVVGSTEVDELVKSVQTWEPYVDAFLTDTFDKTTGARGATGKVHDWSISQRIVESTSKTVILAGGLKPSNLREAIRTVKPSAVDAHTGVESESGFKDPELVKTFVEIANQELE